jgi:hypothetical protein
MKTRAADDFEAIRAGLRKLHGEEAPEEMNEDPETAVCTQEEFFDFCESVLPPPPVSSKQSIARVLWQLVPPDEGPEATVDRQGEQDAAKKLERKLRNE